MPHIMIVDDETAIVDLIEVYLKNEGYTVHKFYNATDALTYVESILVGVNPNGSEFQFQYTYFTQTGTWWLTNNNLRESALLTEDQINVYSQKYENWLSKNISLPEKAEFSVQNKNTLRWDCQEPEDIVDSKVDFCSGVIMANFDEQGNLGSIHYQMSWNQFVTMEEIISPRQAYEKVGNGEFYRYSPFRQGDLLVIEKWEVLYTYDTKGFYQPVYEFTGYINDVENFWLAKSQQDNYLMFV